MHRNRDKNMSTREDLFDTSVSFPLDKSFLNKSGAQIAADQTQFDQVCLEKIQTAHNAGILDKESADLLKFYYQDGMKIYTEMFRSIYNVFGEEENIQIVDGKSGELIMNQASLKHITPNNHTILTYRDHNQNPIYLTLPGIKDIDRAIQKLSTKGKYHEKYKRKRIELYKQYRDNPEAYQAALEKLKRPHEMMGDILRFSISMKRYADIVEWKEKAISSGSFNIDQSRVKDKFCNNDISRSAEFSDRNFRNMVFYLELPNGAKIEVQEKITALEKADKLTHPFYEIQREFDESLPHRTDPKDIEHTKMKIRSLDNTIFQINSLGIEKHNQNEVLEKVMRMEEKFRILGAPRLPDGTYEDCTRFLKENFLVRPMQDLDPNQPLKDIPWQVKRMYAQYRRNPETKAVPHDFKLMFSIYDKQPELQHLFKDATPEIKEIFNRYKKVLTPKYRCVIANNNTMLYQQHNLAQKAI